MDSDTRAGDVGRVRIAKTARHVGKRDVVSDP